MTVTILQSCNQSEEKISIPGCIGDMIQRYEKELKCTKQGSWETNLYRGTYKNQQVYYANTMCINCGVMPPQYGYDCSGKKIEFTSFQEVSNEKQVYNSCTQKITE